MKTSLLTAVLNWYSPDHEVNEKFVQYLSEYNKNYGTLEEFNLRRDMFINKDKLIESWNNKSGQYHILGHNKFSDWTADELKKMGGLKKDIKEYPTVTLDASQNADSIDWNAKGAVSPVGNQLVCMSGWAFAAIGAIESANFVKNGKLVKLSEQEAVDCAGSDACRGGRIGDVFEFAEGEDVETEAEYPYTGFADSCWDKSGAVGVNTVTQVPKKSTAQMKAALNKGPVAASIDSTQYPFMHYMGGVITDESCGVTQDHGVLVVGYGMDAESSQEYYLVKNSWGADWGENGYVRIGITGDGAGICGIQSSPVYPSIK